MPAKIISPRTRGASYTDATATGRWAGLPLKAKIAYARAIACVLFALGIILGNGFVRSGYMHSQDVAAYALAFFLIQIGILAAATVVSMHHSHPYGRRWRHLSKRLKPAAVLATTTVTLFKDLVGKHNALIDRRVATLALAGHTVEASRADVPRQQLMARHWELMASPEAVEERLFPNPVKDLSKPGNRAVVDSLIGIADLPKFERKETTTVHKRQAELRTDLNDLRDERRKLRRGTRSETVVPGTPTSLPVGDEEIETEVPDPEQVKRNGEVKTAGKAA